MRLLLRAAAGAAFGALAATSALSIFYARTPAIVVDPGVTAVVRGAYPLERSGDQAFFWAGPAATLALTGLDRHVPWSCTVRLRGARQDPATLPEVTATAEHAVLATVKVTNDYLDWTFVVPPAASLTRSVITISASSSFKPGRGDSRDLALQITRWTCAPASGARAWPPHQALTASLIAGGIWGLAFALAGFSLGPSLLGAALVAVGQAAVIVRGFGVFLPYVWTLAWLAGGVAAALVVTVAAIERVTRRTLFAASRFTVAFSAGALYLKLAALLHPSKPLVDALFHAHRFEWVLGGKFLFTQPLYSGVDFPYAIGLYLAAAPWAGLTHNHVALLDVVVAVAEALAGALLYLTAARVWRDRLAGAMAVVLFSGVPLAYDIVGHANLTNAFGQSVALMTIIAIVLTPLSWRRVFAIAGITAIATLALLSHVSTFALLVATLGAIVGFYGLFGGPSLRQDARIVFVITLAATALSVALYYGHFMDSYRSVLHARVAQGTPAGATTAAHIDAAATPVMPTEGAVKAAAANWGQRTANAFALSAAALGWPIVLLAVAGAWRTWRAGWRDRLSLAIGAWALAFAAFMLLGIAAPVDAANQRYAVEFVGRAVYATYPAAVLLAARGGAWAWRTNLLLRIGASVLVCLAAGAGIHAWLGWLA